MEDPTLNDDIIINNPKKYLININFDSNLKILTASQIQYDMSNPLQQEQQSLARVGVQFSVDFLHKKFQRSFMSSENNWLECRKVNKFFYIYLQRRRVLR